MAMHKLKCSNQWEVLIFEANGKRINDISSIFIDGVEYKAQKYEGRSEVFDMGRAYSQKYTDYKVEIPIANKNNVSCRLSEILNSKMDVMIDI